jgi:hypothetical protein
MVEPATGDAGHFFSTAIELLYHEAESTGLWDLPKTTAGEDTKAIIILR